MTEQLTRRDRKRIFQEELSSLYEKGYLTGDQYTKITQIYDAYYEVLEQERQPEQRNEPAVGLSVFKKDQPSQHEEYARSTPLSVFQVQDSVKMRDGKKTLHGTQVESKRPEQTIVPTQERMEKEQKQVKEKRITWALNLGVCMILLSGLIVATTSWPYLSDWAKTVAIALVGGFFFAVSFFVKSKLHIDRTAFAFYVLGSLFLPIVFISIGHYRLFGEWFSLYGDGKYLFSFMSTLLCLFFYYRSVRTYNHRLFIWLCFVFSSASVALFLASFYLTADFFFFGMMLFNAGMLSLYHKRTQLPWLSLFFKDLPLFTQLHIILSTVWMVAIYDDLFMNGLNLMLGSLLYLSMIFVFRRQHYHFVFTVVLVYGFYRFVEHSFFASVDLLMYSLIGVLYTILYQWTKESFLQKLFQYTGGMISLVVFIYITVQGMIFQTEQGNLLLLISYIVIALNYLYLSNLTKNKLFAHASSILFGVVGLQGWIVLYHYYDLYLSYFSYFELYHYGYALVLFFFIYYRPVHPWLVPLRESSLVVSFVLMGLSLSFTLVFGKWIVASLLFFISAVVALLFYRRFTGSVETLAHWAFQIALASSVLSLYGFLQEQFIPDREIFDISFHFAFVGALFIGSSLIWERHGKKLDFANSAFYVGQVIYFFSLYLLLITNLLREFTGPHTDLITPVILFGSIVFTVWLAVRSKLYFFYAVVAILAYVFYFIWIPILEIKGSHYLFFAPLLYMLVGEGVSRKYPVSRPYFFWINHVFLLNITIYGLSAYFVMSVLDGLPSSMVQIHPYIFFIPFAIYLYSTWRENQEWSKKLFLYFAYTMIPLLLAVHLDHFEIDHLLTYGNVLLGFSVILIIVWFVQQTEWRRRTDYYLIPLVLYTALYLSLQPMETWVSVFYPLGLLVLSLYFLHVRKWDWITVLPLLISLVLVYQLPVAHPLYLFMILCGLSLLFMVIGKVRYRTFIADKQLDWYSVISVFTLLLALHEGQRLSEISFITEVMIRISVPLILTIFLYLQIQRIRRVQVQRILQTATWVSGFSVYYAFIRNFTLPELLQTELLLLPLIILLIALSITVWKEYPALMNRLQLILLLIVTLILVGEAISSGTIYDVLLIGCLSLVSLLGGMHFKIKSYFVTGTVVLLFNLFYATREFWASLPWWVYLLSGGIILISIASFYEWQKQRPDPSGKTLIQTQTEKLKRKWEEWD